MKREFIGENERFRKKTKNYTHCGVNANTLENLESANELLARVTNDEHFYNHEISDATHKMRMELTEMIYQIRKELTK